MRHSHYRAFALLLGLAFPALASDGVIEINQARALAGGVTPGDTAGFPVTISQSGSYKLTGNLDITGLPTPENITVVDITASSVTIDLNQFSILGATTCTGAAGGCTPSSGTGSGIKAEAGANWTTVLNGTVRGMGKAGLELSQFGRIEGMVLTQNRVWGLTGLASFLVHNCLVTHNGLVGVQTGGYAVITDNTIFLNGGFGIDVFSGASIRGNTVAGNATSGIHTGGGSVISDNSITSNQGYGIEAFAGGVGYARNVLTGNNSSGLQVFGSPIELGSNICETDTVCP